LMSLSDAKFCEQLTRRHGRTFSVASFLLPAEKRRGANALYAFCRVADDLVDQADSLVDAAFLSRRLEGHRRALDLALAGRGTDPVFRELAWAIEHFGIASPPLHELLDGVAVDVTVRRWHSWSELLGYCEGVAGCVGEMCAAVMGVTGGRGARPVAVAHARALGVAMQLTNVLRDVGEDARRGRCYLPLEELEAHGLSVDAVLDGSALHRARWRALMQKQVARARHYYHVAAPGISLLESDAQRCVAACAVGYSRILDAIERNGYDSFTRRATLGWSERAMVLGRAFLDPSGSAVVRASAPVDITAA
ncbi:MAG: phytoene/squalene synthase family protein, partial [Cytophagaceae bacterium]|nr:phytoene/squalene synthase family protein [Gemmatimonadaceae bacterium]